MKKEIIIYNECKLNNEIITYVDLHSNEIKEMPYKDKFKYNHFRTLKGYSGKDDLLRFKEDFLKYVKEIDNERYHSKIKNDRCKINYLNAKNHEQKVFFLFYDMCPPDLYKKFVKVNADEFHLFQYTYNAGIITLDKEYQNQILKVYSYDFKAYFPNMMQHIKISTKSGKFRRFESVDFGNLQYGIYRCKIVTRDPNLQKLFCFSRENHYTSITLENLYKNKEYFKIDEFELLATCSKNDNIYNAYVYDEKDLIDSKDLFGDWFKFLEKLKEKFPSNPLVKHLFSSLWGSLCKQNKKYINNLEDYDVSYIDDNIDSEYKIINYGNFGYECVKPTNAYDNPLARMLPFMTSYARTFMLDYIIENKLIDDVIAIATDRFTLLKKYTPSDNKYHPIFEKKSSGRIKFYNKTFYRHVCKECNAEYKYCSENPHTC